MGNLINYTDDLQFADLSSMGPKLQLNIEGFCA